MILHPRDDLVHCLYMKTRVLIIGGGFAGLRTARLLRKKWRKIDVTLVTDSTTFRYCPALYRSATGFRMRESIIPISQITRRYLNINIIHQKANYIDRSKKTVTLEDGREIEYDYVVICLGVVTSYFGIPGLEENSFSIKTPEGLQKLKTHLHKTLNDTGAPDTNYVVVGGGPTGVELSAALGTYLRDICRKHKTKKHAIHLELVEGAPRVLPVLNEKASKITAKHLRKLGIKLILGDAVKGETADNLTLADRTIPSHTVIWTAGVTNNPFFKENSDQFTLNERGKVAVNEFMQVDDHTFVIGDNAATDYSGLAQTAVRDASYTAKAITSLTKGKKLKAYHQKRPISIVPAGKHWSVLQYKNFVVGGYIPNVLRELADLVGYTDIMGIKQALSVWLKRNTSEETCKKCSLDLKY